ncbi:hypothetical protein OAY95_02460 [Candidatus Pelagibacter sp.]|nr:hypothetical protein [Candidatus Pelagibacter sp.]
MRDDIKDLVAEALRLNSSMKKDRARLAELKSIILAESQGRNASFKIYTDVGEARFNKRKEKLTYTFDERYFLNLDEETQKKMIDDKIVDKEISYHLNFEKYEILKKYPDNDIIKSLVKEHFKDSYFSLAFYPIKNQSNKFNTNQEKNTKKEKSLVNKFKDLFK